VTRALAFGLLLALASCNRSGVADVTLDADASQRNAAAAKTLADLQAATAASQGPPPIVHDAEPVNRQATDEDEVVTEERRTAQPAEEIVEAEDQAAPPANVAASADSDAR
jgi:hypothetical protein